MITYVRSDVYQGTSCNEDGETREELSFYVTIESDRGDRWVSRASFNTEEWTRSEASAFATQLCDAVARYLDRGYHPATSPLWTRVNGAYGTAAWSAAEDNEADARELEAEGRTADAQDFRKAVGL